MILPYKDDSPSRQFACFMYTIMAVNVGVFIYQLSLGKGGANAFLQQYGMVPILFSKCLARPWKFTLEILLSPLTTTFLHGSLPHILYNMLFLWIFGSKVEEKLGHFRFLVFYLACGVIASFSHYILQIRSLDVMVGASGSIAGVMGAYLWLFPTVRIRCIIIVFPFFYFLLPAWVILIYWIVTQITSAYFNISMGAGNDIAWFAHIGGFIAGITYVSRRFPRG